MYQMRSLRKASCPVGKELLLEKYTPRGKIGLCPLLPPGKPELSPHYKDIFAKCLLCGACVITCPSGVNLNEVFLGMREELAKEGLPPEHGGARAIPSGLP